MTNKQLRSANLRPASFSAADNTIDVVWTTGASVRRRDYRRDVVFDEILEVSPGAVRLDRLNAGAPLLNTHNDSSLQSVIGSVVPGSARIEGGVGVARVALSNAASDADVVAKIRDGIIRNISVGYIIHHVDHKPGQGGADETRVAVDWEPLELSAVPVPADAGAHFRSHGQIDQDGSVEAIRARMRMRQHAAGLTPLDTPDWRCLWLIPKETQHENQ